MSIWNHYTEEQGNSHWWPWEEEQISPAEYERSLHGLMNFLRGVNVDELQTLEDVSAVASVVGHDICTIAAVKGQQVERRVTNPERGEHGTNSTKEYVFVASVCNKDVVVTASNGYSYISVQSMVGRQNYQREELRVRLPADRDIAIGNIPNVDENGIYAIDLRAGCRKKYHPTQEPENAEVQKGFIGVLKDTVRELLAVLS